MFSQLFKISSYSFNPYALPVLLVSIFILSIGFLVLKEYKKSIINIAFFCQCFSTGFWLFTISFVYLSRLPETAILWYRYFTFFGVINIMPSLFFLAIVWSGKFKEKKLLVISNYVIAFVFYFLAITTDKVINTYEMRKYFWGFYPIYAHWSLIFIFIYLVQSIVGLLSLYSAYKNEKIAIKKTQVKLITIATLIAMVASIDFLPKFFPLSFYPWGYIPMLIYISMVAYSIVRYKAFDIETVIHKTIGWLFTFSFIIVPMFFAYRWSFQFIKDSIILQIGFWVANFLIITLYLRMVQPKIDHFFQRRLSNLYEATNRFTEDLVHLKGLTQLVSRISVMISETLYPQYVDIFIYDQSKDAYRLFNTSGSGNLKELNVTEPFLQWLALNNKITYKEYVDIDPGYTQVKEQAERYFNLTEASVVIPLILNEKLLGVINLGKKSSLKRYSAGDFHFLTTIKNQSSIAISNSLLYDNIEEQVKQRTKELVEVQKQLVQAEKLATVGTLAGGVAHEINNPLTAILTNVQMLLMDDQVDNKLDKESLELIEEATKRCRTIVQKLMAYAKKPLETTGVSEVNLSKAVKNVSAFLNYQLEQENIRLVAEANEDNCLVRGDQNELEQVLTNIILNAKDAIKRVKKAGDIHIRLLKSADWVKIEIKDEGCGIPKEIISKIFDPFFTTKDVGKGLGLGLSICHAIIEKHNGTINVKSEIGKGSIFTIKLPKLGLSREVIEEFERTGG